MFTFLLFLGYFLCGLLVWLLCKKRLEDAPLFMIVIVWPYLVLFSLLYPIHIGIIKLFDLLDGNTDKIERKKRMEEMKEIIEKNNGVYRFSKPINKKLAKITYYNFNKSNEFKEDDIFEFYLDEKEKEVIVNLNYTEEKKYTDFPLLWWEEVCRLA